MNYPQSYHAAMNHLIVYGCWQNVVAGRRKVARALVDLRRTRGRESARRERRHMQYVAGIPVKPSHPLAF